MSIIMTISNFDDDDNDDHAAVIGDSANADDNDCEAVKLFVEAAKLFVKLQSCLLNCKVVC